MRKLLLVFLFGSVFLSVLKSQDAHYSQVFQFPLLLNSALTGLSSGNFRLGGAYRNQWKSANSPYESFNFFFDKSNNKFSYGLLMNQNNAGIEGLNTTNLLLSFSLKKQLQEGENWLSFGSQVGFIQQRFDLSKLTFDKQYNPAKGFDASLENGESFQKTSTFSPDINVGINWRFSKNASVPIKGDVGISFAHVNTPKSSFFNENIHIPLKTTFYLKPQFDFNPKLGMQPFIIFTNQGIANEFLYGLNAVFSLNESKLKIGIGNRAKDALILMTTFSYKNFELGISYDAHSQDFGYANNVSSIEFSLTYLFGANTKPEEIEKQKDLEKETKKGGRKQDSSKPIENDDDNDGIPNDQDLCPFESGIAKFQGCNDRDFDGVFDNEDACPSLPGTLENYGCPLKNNNLDSDGDGVKDIYDDCVYIRGPAFLNGCPDSDGDDISDYEDQCPYLKGSAETFGCPTDNDKNNEHQKSTDFMEFETNSSTIKSQYFPFLDRLAFQLKNNDELKIVIEGHTDQEGDHLYNYHLSQQRAYNVRNYFYKNGVPLGKGRNAFLRRNKTQN